jgi:hypothetical protein
MMKLLLTALLLTSTAACVPLQKPPPISPACAAIPGIDIVLNRPERYLVFGEIHGTAEAPAMFAEIACSAASRGPVVVGLEWPDKRQQAIDTFMASDGGPAAQAALLASRGPIGLEDGRNSVAVYSMIERLREMKAKGAGIRIVAFVAAVKGDPSGSQSPYDKGLADTLVAGAGQAKRVLVLVGNLHSRRDDIPANANYPGLRPMAADLPEQETLSFNLRYLEGEAWNCQPRAGATASDTECSDHPMPASADPGEIGIRILPQRHDHHDGTWMIGRPTGSPPAASTLAGR